MLVTQSKNVTGELTHPFPKEDGWFLVWRGGNVCHPLSPGNWFSVPYFTRAIRFFCRWNILPYLCWKYGDRAGYFGFKIYGADSPTYASWIPAEEIYSGSQALHFSIRLGAKLNG